MAAAVTVVAAVVVVVVTAAAAVVAGPARGGQAAPGRTAARLTQPGRGTQEAPAAMAMRVQRGPVTTPMRPLRPPRRLTTTRRRGRSACACPSTLQLA